MASRIVLTVCAFSLLSAGFVAPAVSANTQEPGNSEGASSLWIECDTENISVCPTSPQVTSVNADASHIRVSWAWGNGTPVPVDVTGLVVRVSPGGFEAVVGQAESTVSIEGLDSGTEYSVTVLAASGLQLGVPSSPVIATTLAATPDAQAASGAFKPQVSPGDVDRLIVTLIEDRSTELVAANAASDLPVAGVSVEDTQDLGAGNVKIVLSQGVSDSDARAIIADLETDPRVESVEVDRRMYLDAYPIDPPNDTNWVNDSLWGLYGAYGVGVASGKDTMNSIWTNTQGSGTVVAVLDTGSTAHPDLDANYVAGYDFVSSSGTSYCRTGATNFDGDYIDTSTYGALGWDSNPLDPGDWTTVSGGGCAESDSIWHGTHVAGTIGAVANNSLYIAGVAPQTQIQPVRVLSFDGGYLSDIIAAITWASGGTVVGVETNPTPANVINLSLGGSGSCSSSTQTAIDAAVGRGAVLVVSAGNSNADAANFTPANCLNVITVAALTSTGARASYSNYGNTVEIAAPGSGIYSTVNTGTTTPVGPTVASYNGTSMAAPHVAGVVALLKSRTPSLTPAQVLTQIQAAALTFPTGTGSDCTTSICGAGVLQARAINTPGISSLSPTSGSTAGGTSVTISGWNLSSPTSVTFAGAAASVSASSATSLTITTPTGAAGAADVVVTTSTGTFTTRSGFTFIAPTPPPPTPSGGGGSSSSAGGTAAAPDEITVTQPAMTTNQVHRAGEFRVVDALGAPVSLRSAALTPNGFAIEGSDWGVTGTGALNSTNQTLIPGDTITISGENLQRLTTVGVYILSEPTWVASGIVSYENEFTASFSVPALPPGEHTLQINVVRQGGVATSLAVGFILAGNPTATPNATGSVDFGNIVAFKPGSSVLSKSAKTKLARTAASVQGANTTGSITAYYNPRGTANPKRVAQKRALNIQTFLINSGVTGPLNITLEPGRTTQLQRSVLTRLSTDTGTTAPTQNNQVSSLIVRYARGVTPTVGGAVRGAGLITGNPGNSLTLGPNLGLGMYRIDFTKPVTLAAARVACTQMSQAKGVEFVEPDRLLKASPSLRFV